MIARGTTLLAKQSAQGEEITFDGITCLANINRNQDDQNKAGEINVNTNEGSIIEFPLDVGVIPQRDSVGVDAYGYQHRVISSKHIGRAIRLVCEVTR